jgi:guanosine-3',5'-bis(diphosphate) 3'-pyrophosphohydrolase
MWQRAASFAARAHRHQVRKDGETPYVSHPLRVAMTVREVFGCADPAALAMAILHDTIEDTTVDYDDLLKDFGAEVADGVAALTKNKSLKEEAREAAYDNGLERADWRARLVKLADTFDNLSDIEVFKGEERAKQLPRLLGRCERALGLAKQDEAGHAETKRAAAAVRELMAQVSARRS